MHFGLFKTNSTSSNAPAASVVEGAQVRLHCPDITDATRTIQVTELIATRFSHDITGSLGAIHNGLELMEDGDSTMRKDAEDLVHSSARRAMDSLSFYRQCYGAGAGQAAANSQQLEQLIQQYIRHFPTLRVSYPALQGVTGYIARIVCNALLLLQETLPRGGEIHCHLQDKSLQCTATSTHLHLKPELLHVLQHGAQTHALTPKTVQPYYLLLLLAQAGWQATLTHDEHRCHLHFSAKE